MNKHILLSALWLCTVGASAQTPKTTTTTGPEITFAALEHDYGTLVQGANGECQFTFTNTGTEPLIISMCQSSCGCVVPSCPREPVAPGKSAAVRVKYDTNRIGPINKSVTVTSNAVGNPVVVLRIKGRVVPPDTTATPAIVPVQPTH